MQENGDQKLMFWRRTLREYRESGLSRRAFSEQRQLSKSTVDYWFGKIRMLEKHNGLVEVRGPVGNPGFSVSSLQVVVGSYRVEVGSGFDAELFTEVVRVLEKLKR